MDASIINAIIQTYGVPVAFVVWIWLEGRKNAVKKDPTAELIETLRSMDRKLDDVDGRLIRVETKMEVMRGG